MRRAGVLALAALVLAGCGGSDGDSANALAWSEGPRVLKPPDLPRDRVLRGEITNRSGNRIALEAAALKLIDQDGRRVKASATFIPGYAHSIFLPRRGLYPERERRRLGLSVELESGKSAPLTVSWHEPRGPRTPVRIDYGSGSLEIR
jgi:hypothetical protein